MGRQRLLGQLLIMADDYENRRPSFNTGRNGVSVRNFRSRPGAPMHDPTSNNPMSADRMTPKSNWDEMFRKVDPALGAINQDLQQRFNPDSLESMASGGMNHAQRWSQAPALRPPDRSWSADPFKPRSPKDNFYVSGNSGFFETPARDGWKSTPMREVNAIRDKYQTKPQFGWGSAFA